MKKKLLFMDFCAGIGGGRSGLERGMNAVCVGFSEIIPASVKTYKTLHEAENEKNYGDLTKINASKLPDFDILIAGFPCQTFSIIGKREGLKDERGQIIYHLIRILKNKNVPYFILENVKGLISHNYGNTVKTIVKALKKAGYRASYKVLNSVEMGVPQLRERVYFIGEHESKTKLENGFVWPDKIEHPDIKEYLCDKNGEILDENEPAFQRYLNNQYNKGKVDINKLLAEEYLVIDTRQSDLRQYRGVVPTLRTGRHGIVYVQGGKFHKLSGYESLLLQGFEKKQAGKTVGRSELSERNLLSQAGNAMTVTVIESLSKQLLKHINV